MNIVVLKGRLVRDSEIREFQNGGKVLSNAMALSRVWYDNNGNKHEETDFVDIKANNGTADFIAKWFKKGDGISIKGRLKQESWQDKDTGANRSRLVVVAEEAHFELGRAENNANSRIEQSAETLAQNIANSGAVMGVSVTNYADSTAGSVVDDEEIPF
nr:single-stranded DNA-binding protein [uncultured Campylobacter sp.]